MIYIHDKFRLPSLLSNFVVPAVGGLKLKGLRMQRKQISRTLTTLSVLPRKRLFAHATPKVEKSITMITSKFLDAKTVDHELSLTQKKTT
jgi:hypothetical protein